MALLDNNQQVSHMSTNSVDLVVHVLQLLFQCRTSRSSLFAVFSELLHPFRTFPEGGTVGHHPKRLLDLNVAS